MKIIEEFYRFVILPETEVKTEIKMGNSLKTISKVKYTILFDHSDVLDEGLTNIERLRAARKRWEADHEGFVRIWLDEKHCLADRISRKKKFFEDMLLLDVLVEEQTGG